jgi:hypothetical protein
MFHRGQIVLGTGVENIAQKEIALRRDHGRPARCVIRRVILAPACTPDAASAPGRFCPRLTSGFQ